MDIKAYENVLEFNQKVLNAPPKDLFNKVVMQLFDDYFSLKHSIALVYSYPYTETTNTAKFTHNIEQDFIYKLIERYNSSFYSSNFDKRNCYKFSSFPSYKKHMLYRELLHPNGYADFIYIPIIINNHRYGYTLCFRKQNEAPYTDALVQQLQYTIPTIGHVFKHNTEKSMLEIEVHKLKNVTSYYPIGIAILNHHFNITYANTHAQNYFRELGIEKDEHFNLFYTNHIMPQVGFDQYKIGHASSFQLKNYTLTALSVSPPYTGVVNNEQLIYLYIVKNSSFGQYDNLEEFYKQHHLTKREQDILQLLLQGKDTKTMAVHLGIKNNTIKVHIQNIFKKTQVSSRMELLSKLKSSSIS